MNTVKDLLNAKGSAVWSVGPDATVLDALRVMSERNIGAVLVMNGDELVGILSERDYARKVALLGKSSTDTLVSEIMTPRVLCVRTAQSIQECMALMTEKNIRHLPVLGDGDRVLGVISMRDVGEAIVAEQEFTITHLENYIVGADVSRYRSR